MKANVRLHAPDEARVIITIEASVKEMRACAQAIHDTAPQFHTSIAQLMYTIDAAVSRADAVYAGQEEALR